MQHAEHVAAARSLGASLVAALRAAPDADVPTCPGWTSTELGAHVGRVLTWWGASAAAGPCGDAVDPTSLPGPPGHDVVDWVEVVLADTVDVVAAMDIASTWSTFLGPRPGTFHARRIAHELAVHRYDAQLAAAMTLGNGAPCPGELLDLQLAVDGIDELLEEFAPRLDTTTLTRASRLHLHGTDPGLAPGEGEWIVDLVPGEPVTFEHGHAKGDLAVRGPVARLVLWMWNRVSLDEGFEVFGDRSVATDWAATIRI